MQEVQDVVFVHGGDRQDDRVFHALVLADLAKDVEPRQARHQEVEHDHVGVLLADQAQRLGSVLRQEHVVPARGEKRFALMEDLFGVVRDENRALARDRAEGARR